MVRKQRPAELQNHTEEAERRRSGSGIESWNLTASQVPPKSTGRGGRGAVGVEDPVAQEGVDRGADLQGCSERSTLFEAEDCPAQWGFLRARVGSWPCVLLYY